MENHDPTANALAHGDLPILGGLALGLLFAMWVGAGSGVRRGPIRALAALAALAASFGAAAVFGPWVGHALLDGGMTPWILRASLGRIFVGAAVWLGVYGWLWWRGRSRNPESPEPDRPVTGALIGCWVATLWYLSGLLVLLTIAGIGEMWLAVSPNPAPWPLRWPMRMKAALSHHEGTAGFAAIDLFPESPRRLLRKLMLVTQSPKAVFLLQSNPAIQALAVDSAVHPLIIDPKIRELVRRQKAQELLTHPKIIALLADEEFQQRLAETEIEPILDDALARAKPTAGQDYDLEKKRPPSTLPPP